MDKNRTDKTSIRMLEKYIGSLKASREHNTLSADAREVVLSMKNHTANARLLFDDAAKAVNAQSRELELKNCIKHLQELQDDTVKAGQLDLLGPADVAQLWAKVEQVIEHLSDSEDEEDN